MLDKTNQSDALLIKINAAVKAANETEATIETAKTELVSRSRVVGQLLLEAKKFYPKVKDFEEYLGRVDGLKLSRAYDLLRLAGGRTTDAELKEAAAERKRQERARKEARAKEARAKEERARKEKECKEWEREEQEREERAKSKPEPKAKDSVTNPDVTESAEASAARRKAEYAQTPAAVSARNLREFEVACNTYLPKLTDADMRKAHLYFARASSMEAAR